MVTNGDDFPIRFKQACDDSPAVPDINDGRYVAISRYLDVSEEAVRKWFEGRSRPRVGTMRKLAKFLNVDEAWLSLGTVPQVSPRERRLWSRKASGAVYVLFGLIRAFGGTSAFPKDDAAEYVTLQAIIDAEPVDLFCTVPHHEEDGSKKIYLPRGHEKVRVVIFVPGNGLQFGLFTIDSSVLETHREHKSGYFEVALSVMDDGNCYTGGAPWKPLESLADLL